MKPKVIIGIDPSSRKLAAVVNVLGDPEFDVHIKHLPAKLPAETCLLAYAWVRRLCHRYSSEGYDVRCYLEAPISAGAKGGVKALLPQAQVSGALLAGAMSVRSASIDLVSIQTWKKQVIGKGNATKTDVKQWAAQYWRAIYESNPSDQDVLDAAAINRYGNLVNKRKV